MDEQSSWLDEPEEEQRKFDERLRKLQDQSPYRKFNVWDPEWIFVTTWFFGYEGSLTEPPVSDRFRNVTCIYLFLIEQVWMDHHYITY